MYRIIVLNIFGLLYVSSICYALDNPNVGNPFNAKNAPTHSGQQQRYINRGNPYGKSANDIVTGNVGGGKHFRGVVPYGSSYYNSAYTNDGGTGSVNNFIRRSQNPISNDRNPGQIRTFIDPRLSVSSVSRPDGTSGLSNPQLQGQGRKTNPYIVPLAEQASTVKYERPFTANNMNLDQILARKEQLEEADRLKNAEKINEESDEESDQETTLEKGFFDDVLPPETVRQKQKEQTEQKPDPSTESQEDSLAKTLMEDQETPDNPAMETEAEASLVPEKTNDLVYKDFTNPKSDFVQDIDVHRLSAEGRKILGDHKTFASLAEEKFSGFMKTAESFIKEGKYYKAADAYSLAIVWKPKDARGYLGQSFSLLGAGEYMSCAYYLSRAFELNPKAAVKKYDLSEFVGNRDVFENRIVEIMEWQQRSGSGELAFLLAYISYQDGKATMAVEQIRKAKESLPNERAVAILKNIIDPEEPLK